MPDEAASGPAAVWELAINASAPLFGVTPEDMRSPQRSRPISDARAVAMTAARENGLSLPSIAEEFGKDHGSVIHAVRRTQQRPRLADAAARVTQHVNDRYTGRLPRPDATAPAGAAQDAATPVPEPAFEPRDLVDHAVVAAAQAFATTPETLIGADRTRAAADARGVAMTAARMRGQSLPKSPALRPRPHHRPARDQANREDTAAARPRREDRQRAGRGARRGREEHPRGSRARDGRRRYRRAGRTAFTRCAARAP